MTTRPRPPSTSRPRRCGSRSSASGFSWSPESCSSQPVTTGKRPRSSRSSRAPNPCLPRRLLPLPRRIRPARISLHIRTQPRLRRAPRTRRDQARNGPATKVTITIEIPGGANAVVLAPRSRLHSGGSPTVPDPGAIAQLGERLTGSQEVSGSIPLGSTTKKASRLSVGEPVVFATRRAARALGAAALVPRPSEIFTGRSEGLIARAIRRATPHQTAGGSAKPLPRLLPF
jgi:hypothetical protein